MSAAVALDFGPSWPSALAENSRWPGFSSLRWAMSAGAAFFWFLVVHRILVAFTPNELVRRVGAFAAVWVSGTAFTVWNQSNVNEKVYTVTLFTIALISWLAFLWRDNVEEHRGQRNRRFHDDNAILLVIFILLGFAAGVKTMLRTAAEMAAPGHGRAAPEQGPDDPAGQHPAAPGTTKGTERGD